MRILIIAHTSFNQIGGHERYTHQFANAMAATLGRKSVVVWPVEQSVPLRRINGQNYTLLSPFWYRNRWARRLVHRYFLLRGFNHLIADAVHLAPYTQKVAKFLGVSYDVMTVGIEVWGNLQTRVMEAMSGARAVLTISAFTQEHLVQKGIPIRQIQVLPPHLDVNVFYPDAKAAKEVIQRHSLKGQRVILTICRMDGDQRYKGYDRVLKSLPLILQQVPTAVYLIVGTGSDQPRMERRVAEMGLADRVIFAGRVPDDDFLRGYYSACDVFAMPSQTVISEKDCKGEGFGIVYIEANACGKPVIAGYGGGEPDAVIDGVTGLLVDPMDVDAIGQAIVRLLTNKELAHRLGQQGLRRVWEEFSLAKLQERVDAYLDDVRSQSAARPRLSWYQTVRRLL